MSLLTAHLLAAAVNNNTGGIGALTLIFPLVLIPIMAVIWTAWWKRRSRNY